MRISNRIFNNPATGSYNHRKAAVVLDTTSTSLPTNKIADGVPLQEGDRALFTGLSDSAINNRVYKLQKSTFIIDADGIAIDGDSVPGDLIYIMQGTHSGDLWGFENNVWEVLDLDTDTSDDGPGAGSLQEVDKFTLNGTDASNKYVTLSAAPATAGKTILIVDSAGGMFYGVDFTVSGNQLSWNGLGLDGILSSGDRLTVLYNV